MLKMKLQYLAPDEKNQLIKDPDAGKEIKYRTSR